MERKYAPYIKWFGTAFSKLESASVLTPLFMQTMEAGTWQERQVPLTKAFEHMAKIHNDLGITDSLDAKVSQFYNRPFLIIRAHDFADAIHASNRPFLIIRAHDFADAIHARIVDDEVKQLPKYLGAIDQYVDSTDVLSYTEKFRRFWSMYQ
jgi:hypothetical protein